MSNPFGTAGGSPSLGLPMAKNVIFGSKKVIFGHLWGPLVTFSGGLKGSNSPPRMCPTMSNHVHPMSNPFGAAGAAYGQKCHFWVKKGHFWAPLGPPGDIFWGPKGFKLTPPDVSNNVQPCSPNVQPIWG